MDERLPMKTHLPNPAKTCSAESPSFANARDHFDPELTVYLKEYGRINLRPIRDDDEERMIRFHESLSEESIYLRYFEHISLDTRTLHERLTRVCTNTPDSYAIVAETHQTGHHPAEIVAVGRLTTTDEPATASFAVLMSDEAQQTALTCELLKRLIFLARAHGFHALTGELLAGDYDTLTNCHKLGFTLQTNYEDHLVYVNHKL